MSDIFISYAREDRETAQRLARTLESQGWSVWWDTRLKAGEIFDEVIERELAAARCVIVLWSKISVQSRWVREEASRGLERQILVPVRIENVQPPLPFGRIHTADLINWKGRREHPGFKKLMADVTGIIGPPLPSPPPADGNSKNTRGFLEGPWPEWLGRSVAKIKHYVVVIAHWRPRKWHLAIAGGIALLVVVVVYSLYERRPPEQDWELFKKVYAFASDPLAGMSLSPHVAREFAVLWTLKCRNKDLDRFKEVYLYASDPLAGMSMSPRDAKEYALKRISCTGAIESE